MEELQEITGKGFQDSLDLSTMAGVDLKVSFNLNGSIIILYI